MEDAVSTSESKPIKKNVKKKYIIGDADVAAWRPNMEIKNPLVDGLSMSIFIMSVILIKCNLGLRFYFSFCF